MDDERTNPFGAPLPSPELRRLEPLLGKWQTTARTQASVFGPAVPVTSIEEFYWLEGGYFLVQTYETAFGDEPAQKGINYWLYDSDVGKFRIIFFSNNGPFTEEGNRYEREVIDGTLTFMGPARFQYDLPGRVHEAVRGAAHARVTDANRHARAQTGEVRAWARLRLAEEFNTTGRIVRARGRRRWV
jgi:Protein of unknown function (DUF1579)